MKVGIVSDHAGYLLKEQIKEKLTNYEIIDFGTDSEESVDYPDYAQKLCDAYNLNEIQKGILICKTGIGMSIAANKVKNIRCAKIDNKEDAQLCVIHNDANVISLGTNHSLEEMLEMILIFLQTTPSTEERHLRRVNKIKNME